MNEVIKWKNVKFNGELPDNSQVDLINDAVKSYVVNDVVKAKGLQEMANRGDYPALTGFDKKIWEKTPAFDTGWQEIFEMWDMTGTTKTSFELLDVEDSLAFSRVIPGEK